MSPPHPEGKWGHGYSEGTERCLVTEGKGDMAIVRIRKDVILQRERRDMAIVRVRKDVMLERERVDMVIVRVRKDVMLLRERGEWL